MVQILFGKIKIIHIKNISNIYNYNKLSIFIFDYLYRIHMVNCILIKNMENNSDLEDDIIIDDNGKSSTDTRFKPIIDKILKIDNSS